MQAVTKTSPAQKKSVPFSPLPSLSHPSVARGSQVEAAGLGIKPMLASDSSAQVEQCDTQVSFERKDMWRKRDFRSFLAARQREELLKAGLYKEFRSLCHCHRDAVPAFVKRRDGTLVPTGSPGNVQLDWYAGDAADFGNNFAYTWLKKCAGALSCFLCAPAIRYYRSEQIREVTTKMLRIGYSSMFWTFTAPHDLNTDPIVQRRAFSNAMKFLKSGRFWNNIKAKYGIEHHVSVVEMTDDSPWSDEKSGTHYHKHFLIFYKCEDGNELTQDEADKLAFDITTKWSSALVKFGLCHEKKWRYTLEHGFRLDIPRQSKSRFDSVDAFAEYLSKSAAIEMTPGIFIKDGKKPDRLSHFQLYTLALTHYSDLIPRMFSIMRALKRGHWIHFSKGLLNLCGVDDKTDEDIMKQSGSHSVMEFDKETWRNIDKYKSQSLIIEEAQYELEERGIDFSEIPLDDNGDLDEDNPKTLAIREVFNNVIKIVCDGIHPVTGESLKEARENRYYFDNPPVLKRKVISLSGRFNC